MCFERPLKLQIDLISAVFPINYEGKICSSQEVYFSPQNFASSASDVINAIKFIKS